MKIQFLNKNIEKYILFSLHLFFIAVVFSISLIEISKGLLFLTTGVWVYKNRKNLPKPGLLEYSLFSFLFLMLLSTMVNFSAVMFKRYIVYLFQILLFFIGIYVFRYRKFFVVIKTAVIAASIAGLYSFVQYAFGWNIPSTSLIRIPQVAKGARAVGTTDYPVHNAFGLGSMLLYVSYILNGKNLNRILFLVSFLLVTAGLFATGTRSVFVGVLISFTILSCVIFNWKKVIPVLLILGVLSYLFFPGMIGNRIRSITDFKSDDFMLRKVIMTSGLMIAYDYPVFGVGPDGFFKHYTKKYKVAAIKQSSFSDKKKKMMLNFSDLNRHFHCHNIYIGTMASFGIPGFLSFMFFIFLFFKKSIKNFRKNISSGIKMYNNIQVLSFLISLALLLQGILDYSVFGPISGSIFWLAAGISCADVQKTTSVDL